MDRIVKPFVILIAGFLLLTSSVWADAHHNASEYTTPYLTIYKGNYAFCAQTNCSIKDPNKIVCNCQLKTGLFIGPNHLPKANKNQVTSLFLLQNQDAAKTVNCKTNRFIDCYNKPCRLVNGKPQCSCVIATEQGGFFTQSTSCQSQNDELPNGMAINAPMSEFLLEMSPPQS